jgi:putative CocE/NonD family hydrolase
VTALSYRADQALSRLLRTPPPNTTYQVHRGLRISMRDDVELIADHYEPDTAEPAGTVLVRGPYGRRWPFSALYASAYATRGYHVVLQSVRGTFGSGGEFEPTVNEADDGTDTVAWLRDQPWFTGSFGTVGPSYLGVTQWALLQDPPPELAAAVIIVGPHDFAAATWGTGSFGVNDFLGWSHMVAHQEDPQRFRALVRQARSRSIVRRAATGLPLGAAGRQLLGASAQWWESWTGHSDPADPFWDPYRFSAALENANVPVLLIGGWQDLFLDQTLQQYRALRERDVDVALTVGPWTHSHVVGKAAPRVLRESLHWLGTHVAGHPAVPRPRVRVCVTGGPGWTELADWPPDTAGEVWYLSGDDRLTGQPDVDNHSGSSAFTYDPQDPTPTVGGRLLSPSSGIRRDDQLARRLDLVTFTSAALPADLFVFGAPVIELAHDSDTPHVDLFVRISEVDAKDRSRNVSDGYVRREPDGESGSVRVELDSIAHRFAAGSRIRLTVGGGSFPRYARNLGTGESALEGARSVRATHVIAHHGSRLTLPSRTTLPE